MTLAVFLAGAGLAALALSALALRFAGPTLDRIARRITR